MNTELGTDNLEFTLKPSQWVTIGWILSAFILIFAGLIFGINNAISMGVICGILTLVWLCKRWIISCWYYDFNERTISERKGVLTIHTREIHYFRIKSIRTEQPLFYRIVGLMTYNIITSDPLIPILKIYAIEDNGELRDKLKQKAIYWRKELGVKETDFHNF
jgi:membrane protein YdbS with pleckstrin-like domain